MSAIFRKSSGSVVLITCLVLFLMVFTGGCIYQSPPVNSPSVNSPSPTDVSTGKNPQSLSSTISVDVSESSMVSGRPETDTSDKSPDKKNTFIEWKPVNLTIGNYSLAASMPAEGSRVMTYRSKAPGLTREWVCSFAKDLGMSGEIRETDEGFFAGDRDSQQFLLSIYKKNATISFSRRTIRAETELSEPEVIAKTTTLLQKNNLLPPGNVTPDVMYALTPLDKKPGEWQRYHLFYPLVIDGIPAHARYVVETDFAGNIVSLTREWRDYIPEKEVSLKSPEDALNDLRQMYIGRGITGKVNVTQVTLIYGRNPSGDSEEYLRPLYTFTGDIEVENTSYFFRSGFAPLSENINATQPVN